MTRKSSRTTYLILISGLPLAFLLSVCYGAVNISLSEMWSALVSFFSGVIPESLNERIFVQIRIPRACMAVLCGAVLAVGGALLQNLFRNPLLDPGLIGTSGGAAFGAAFYLVFGTWFGAFFGGWGLSFFSFAGALLSTFLVLALSGRSSGGSHNSIMLLLTGIAISALFSSAVGFFTFMARDPQARSITFWNLGTLSGADSQQVLIVSVSFLCCFALSIRLSRGLDALLLGENEAAGLGVNVRKMRISILLVNCLMVSVVTSFVGVISFVGIIVPHLLRRSVGIPARKLLPASALLGAILLSVSDLAARMLIRPAELPIGVVTSLVGVPVFVLLLRTRRLSF